MICKICNTRFIYRENRVCARCRVASGEVEFKECFVRLFPLTERKNILGQRRYIKNDLDWRLKGKFAEEYSKLVIEAFLHGGRYTIYLCLRKWKNIARGFKELK